MRLLKEKMPVFTLYDKEFNQLKTSAQIAIYAMSQQIACHEEAWSTEKIKVISKCHLGMTDDEFKNAFDFLVSIGYIEVEKD